MNEQKARPLRPIRVKIQVTYEDGRVLAETSPDLFKLHAGGAPLISAGAAPSVALHFRVNREGVDRTLKLLEDAVSALMELVAIDGQDSGARMTVPPPGGPSGPRSG